MSELNANNRGNRQLQIDALKEAVKALESTLNNLIERVEALESEE